MKLMANLETLTHQDIYKQYRSDIEKAFQVKMTATAYLVQSIIEIGRVCLEAKSYNDKLRVKDKKKLWREFSENLPISKSSISKYIAVAKHPIIGTKKYQKSLPPSIFTLYELSKISNAKLEKLITTKKIHADMGRSELNKLLGINITVKGIGKTSNEVEILSLRLPLDIWEDKFEDVKEDLMQFLAKKGILYEYGSEIRKRERLELSQQKKFNNYIQSQLRKICLKKFKNHIDNAAYKKNPIAAKSMTFDQKLKLLKFNKSEVNFKECVGNNEIEYLYLQLDLGTQDEWNKLESDIYTEAFEKYPPPQHILNSSGDKSSHELKGLPSKTKKRDFSGFKV